MYKTGAKIVKVLTNIFVLLFTLSAIFPVVWMLYTSLKTNKEFLANTLSFPIAPTLINYLNTFEVGELRHALFSSVFNTIITVPLIVFFSFILAYFFARFKFRGKGILFGLILIGMLVPLHSLLVPLFVQFKTTGMLDNRFTLILPYIAFNLPLSVFLFQSFIKEIPSEIEEAAYIDGSSFDRTLFRIILPICMPMVATVAILNVLHVWNEFPFALVLNKSPEFYTLPVWLTFFNGAYTTDYTGKIAGLMITSLPTIILYMFFSKRIIQGMTSGSVKG
ncbi:carbohydrate ABC transporter permease [Gracilibacillus salinarum]|uniref:Carbohydrate ABC transporter permease n=1 Tax=Gracilibacillus salinarum TaxID=2932255 RepID=A0ABY4GRG1_9BACI|nr:carbohydrate ABC transporter permease [Gracilibacillus salinarum]UOQ86983.1 carbohydrate ABC transporter permease [Gracilibacillus salinarum]